MTSPMRVAVMQPYFFPYAGYFRLFAACDAVVLFDCVQFPRRGRVHRCALPGAGGANSWLTLPLRPAARATSIAAMRLAGDAPARWAARCRKLDAWRSHTGESAVQVLAWLDRVVAGGYLVDLVEPLLLDTAALFGFRPRVVRSSSLALDPALRGQARVIGAARALGAREYVNAPGGRALYDPCAFADAGMRLRFLEPYAGEFPHLLPALLTQPARRIAADILETTRLDGADQPASLAQPNPQRPNSAPL